MNPELLIPPMSAPPVLGELIVTILALVTVIHGRLERRDHTIEVSNERRQRPGGSEGVTG